MPEKPTPAHHRCYSVRGIGLESKNNNKDLKKEGNRQHRGYTLHGYGRELPAADPKRMWVRMPIASLQRLASLHAKTILVALLLQRQADVVAWPVVRLPIALFNLFGLRRMDVSRALTQLESAGLVRVYRRPGKRSTVTIRWSFR
jgi:hypothetical protein